MATDRPRFSVSLDDETFERVEQYRVSNRFSTRSKAVEALIRDGLQKILAASLTENEKAPSVSDEAMQIATAFDQASEKDKNTVRQVLDEYMSAPVQKGGSAKLA